MKAAFIHDHRFPMKDGKYYSSSGFENSFISRYIEIFGNIKIIARSEELDTGHEPEQLNTNCVEFYTIENTKSLLLLRNYRKLKNEICDCQYAVIRMPSIIGLFSGYICRKNKIPFLVEVVGCPWDSMAFKGKLWDLFGRAYSFLMKRMIIKSKYVVYVSEKFLEDRYPTNGKYTNISNIVLNNYGTCDISIRKKKIEEYDPKKKMIIGSCGSLSAEYKSQEDVIRIIPLLREKGINVVYQLVGGGSPNRLLQWAKEYNVVDYVDIIGELKHEDVFSWMDGLDFYVHPSKQEGLCRAIIEAMSRACPIIAADAGGIHEQISDEYIFPKGDYIKMLNLLVGFGKEEMLKEGLLNFENASKYQSEILNNRRLVFFKDFISQR